MAIANVTHEDLRRRREQAGISREELAYVLGCSVASIERFENGKRPLPRRYSLDDYNQALLRIWERRKPQ